MTRPAGPFALGLHGTTSSSAGGTNSSRERRAPCRLSELYELTGIRSGILIACQADAAFISFTCWRLASRDVTPLKNAANWSKSCFVH